jgi:hypothetical protein
MFIIASLRALKEDPASISMPPDEEDIYVLLALEPLKRGHILATATPPLLVN